MKKLILSIVLLITTSAINAQNQNPFEVKVVGKGEPVILIPGYSCPGEVWNETVEQFKNNYQFHIISIAGFGGTKPIQNDEILKSVRDAIIVYTKEKNLKKTYDHRTQLGCIHDIMAYTPLNLIYLVKVYV